MGCGMRRFVAALMMVGVLMAIMEPYATATSLAATPACCRRNGKHRCMAMARVDVQSQEGNAVGNVPEKCPMRACVRSTATPYSNLPPRALASVPATYSAVVAYEPVVFLSAGFSSHTDRGPPLLA